MARRGYPPEYRRRVVGLVGAGSRVSEVAADLGIGEQTVYTWRRQDRIDRGSQPGSRLSWHRPVSGFVYSRPSWRLMAAPPR